MTNVQQWRDAAQAVVRAYDALETTFRVYVEGVAAVGADAVTSDATRLSAARVAEQREQLLAAVEKLRALCGSE